MARSAVGSANAPESNRVVINRYTYDEALSQAHLSIFFPSAFLSVAESPPALFQTYHDRWPVT